MTSRIVLLALAASVVCGACRPSMGRGVTSGRLTVRYAMIPAPGSEREAPVYLIIENRASAPAVLTTVSSPDADSVIMFGAPAQGAQRVASVTVPRRSTLQLTPGGHHLLLVGVHRELATGDTATLVLQFAPPVGRIALPAPVVPFITSLGTTNSFVWWCAALAAAGDNRMELSYFWASILIILLPIGIFGVVAFYVGRAAYRSARAQAAARATTS